jgi:hypothetical protein
VDVHSSAGYDCLQEIDLLERTRSWTFYPAFCTFDVDAFANVVTDQDKRSGKTTAWYRQVQKSEEDLFRALEDAAKGSGSPNSRK